MALGKIVNDDTLSPCLKYAYKASEIQQFTVSFGCVILELSADLNSYTGVSMQITSSNQHRRRLWGVSPGTRPPIIRRGAKPLFCPPNNQRIIFLFLYLKK